MMKNLALSSVVSIALWGLSLASTGCGSASYVWVTELPPESAGPSSYAIAAGDLLVVHVFNQENLTTRSRVRADGRIAVPIVGEVDVLAKSPAELSRDLEARLKEFVTSPKVTVTVEETQGAQIVVIGEVAHPGVFAVDASAGLLRALALAGGLTDYASQSSIFVLRGTPPRRIRFTYASLTDGLERPASFRLRSGDVVVVE